MCFNVLNKQFDESISISLHIIKANDVPIAVRVVLNWTRLVKTCNQPYRIYDRTKMQWKLEKIQTQNCGILKFKSHFQEPLWESSVKQPWTNLFEFYWVW